MSVFLFPTGGGAAADQYLSAADGTEIGSSGAVDDGSGNTIELAIANGQAAAVAGNGLSGLIGAVYWSLGSTPTGNINTLLELASVPNQVHVAVAVWRASSAPTSLQDIEDASAHWLQVIKHNSGNVSTYVKNGTAALSTTANENGSGSVSVAYTVCADANGFGGAASRHEYSSSAGRELGTEVSQASGDFYVALLWGKLATAGSDETVGVKLRAGFLQ